MLLRTRTNSFRCRAFFVEKATATAGRFLQGDAYSKKRVPYTHDGVLHLDACRRGDEWAGEPEQSGIGFVFSGRTSDLP